MRKIFRCQAPKLTYQFEPLFEAQHPVFHYPREEIERRTNIRQGKSMNIFLGMVKGDIQLRLDGDVILAVHHL